MGVIGTHSETGREGGARFLPLPLSMGSNIHSGLNQEGSHFQAATRFGQPYRTGSGRADLAPGTNTRGKRQSRLDAGEPEAQIARVAADSVTFWRAQSI